MIPRRKVEQEKSLVGDYLLPGAMMGYGVGSMFTKDQLPKFGKNGAEAAATNMPTSAIAGGDFSGYAAGAGQPTAEEAARGALTRSVAEESFAPIATEAAREGLGVEAVSIPTVSTIGANAATATGAGTASLGATAAGEAALSGLGATAGAGTTTGIGAGLGATAGTTAATTGAAATGAGTAGAGAASGAGLGPWGMAAGALIGLGAYLFS